MYRSDVELLKADEHRGETVVSWHSAALWNACKGLVTSDEHARRISKMMRDNRHSLMHALSVIADEERFAFLVSLLELNHADYDIEFVNLRVKDHLTVFDELKRTPRTSRYAAEQKARRCRVAFGELFSYFQKRNRNALVVRDETSDKLLAATIAALNTDIAATEKLDKELSTAGYVADGAHDTVLRDLLQQNVVARRPSHTKAMELLQRHMDAVGCLLASRWNDERYVRELRDTEENLEENFEHRGWD
jgi:hypothetical protein